ncbi:MAG: polymerase sigma-70 factor, subfamily [Nocardioidaceae bacterium]|nr:polymerase sigma-70 factor, subfamily [Nocardioidaceae bacterium]
MEDAPDYSIFFGREYSRVLGTVYLIIRDRGRAEDITQEAFFQLLRHWPRVAELDWPEAWVRRVAVRLALRHARRDALRSVLERQTAISFPRSDPDLNLAELLRELSAPQRTAIVLHYYEDQPTDQIATIMGCSINTVKSHLHRGRNKLHRLLLREEGCREDV